MDNRRNQFMKEIQYTPLRNGRPLDGQTYAERQTQTNEYRRTNRDVVIKKPKTSKKRFTTKHKIVAAMLAVGAITISGMAIRAGQEKQPINIKSSNQIEEFNIKAQTLGISQELYDKALQLENEVEVLNLDELSNSELSSYFNQIAELELDLLKQKVSTLTGMKTNEFLLWAPGVEGGVPIDTRVVVKDEFSNSGYETKHQIQSSEINNYMNEILHAREYSQQLKNDDVNRNKMEKELLDMKDTIGELMSINLIRGEGMYINSYRIEKNDVKNNNTVIKSADLEK